MGMVALGHTDRSAAHERRVHDGGSVCAFDATDGVVNDDLSTYFDLITLWVARQLYLSIFHMWPGRQILHTAHERLRDQQLGELCGCVADTGLQYEQCCRTRDLAIPRLDRLREYFRHFPYPVRDVPREVLRIRRAIWTTTERW